MVAELVKPEALGKFLPLSFVIDQTRRVACEPDKFLHAVMGGIEEDERAACIFVNGGIADTLRVEGTACDTLILEAEHIRAVPFLVTEAVLSWKCLGVHFHARGLLIAVGIPHDRLRDKQRHCAPDFLATKQSQLWPPLAP